MTYGVLLLGCPCFVHAVHKSRAISGRTWE
jgi:hypothetical protein